MKFIVVLVAMLVERFFDWSHIRQWRWFEKCQHYVTHKLPAQSPYLVLAVSIIPLVMLVAIADFALHGVLYGFVKLLFELFVLIYCLGPQNLWADTFSSINALEQGDANFAADKLKTTFGITDIRDLIGLHNRLLKSIFIEANRRVFAVIFWFAVLGPAGAFLYRLVALSANEIGNTDAAPDVIQAGRTTEAILDWLPIRLFTFIFALGGHFVQVLSTWRKMIFLGVSGNDNLLMESGVAALGEDHERLVKDCVAEKNAISLLDRAFVIVLVIVAIVVMLT